MRFPSRTLVGLLVAAGVAACSDTKTIDAPIPAGMHAGKIAINPEFSPTARTIAKSLADFGITFGQVRVTIRNNPDTAITVLDTTVAFTPSSSPLALDLTVPVEAVGQVFNALVEYIGQGGVVYSGSLLVQSYAPGGEPPEEGALVLNFVGPGSKLKTIAVTPDVVNLVGSQSVGLTIAATDSSGATIAVPPLVFASSDESIAKVVASGSGWAVQSSGKRGEARITALTPIGISDTISARVTLPAASIVLVSGGGQTGTVGAGLKDPAVIQVNAGDGVGVAGVAVTFAAPIGGGVGTTTATTDANGRASTTMTLATAAGPQSFLATATGLNNLPIPATAVPGPISATKSLISATSPILADNVTSSVITVQTRDDFQNPITVGGATINLTTTFGHFGAGTATTTVAKDNGDGTYTAALLSPIGGTATISASIATTPFTNTATTTFVGATLDHFDVTNPDGTPIGPTIAAATSFPVKITARDAGGTVVPGFTGVPTIRVSGSSFFGPNDSLITAPAAVAGVSTANVAVARTGSQATLDVSAIQGQSVKSGHSATFSVTAGPAALIRPDDSTKVYNLDQTPSAYPFIYVTDAAGNITGRQTVAFTVSGPCTLQNGAQSAQYTSDAEGVVVFNASMLDIPTGTLIPFSCQLVATGVGFTAPTMRVALLAQDGGMTSWTGHTDNQWELKDNWTVDTPSSSMNVFIPASQPRATPRFPVLHTSGTYIPSLDVEDGARLDLNGQTVSVFGAMDARNAGTITNGTLVGVCCNESLMRGSLPNVQISGGTYSVATHATVNGSLSIDAGSIDPAGNLLFVTKDLATSGSGTLFMMQEASGVFVSGSATFAARVGSGTLAAGVLSVAGNFQQNGSGTFTPGDKHVVLLNAASTTPQTVTFEDLTNSWFQNLSVILAPGGKVTIGSAVKINGGLDIGADAGGGATLGLPNGLYNQLNGPISIHGTSLVADLGGVINTSGLVFAAGSSVTLQGNATLNLANGALAFGANSHVTINVTGRIAPPSSNNCSRGPGVVIDGSNVDAVKLLNDPAVCPLAAF
jgi:hypothetical protein